MSTIQINDRYRITTDPLQWIVQRRGWSEKHDDWGEWNSIMYFGSLSGLVPALYDRLLRESEAEGMGELLKESERLSKTISDALAPHLSITLKDIRG